MTISIKKQVTPTRPSIVGEFVKDLNAFTFKDMQLNDTFSTAGLFSGVSEEPMVWRLTEANFSMTDLIFEVTYMGVLVGEFSIQPAQNNKVTLL